MVKAFLISLFLFFPLAHSKYLSFWQTAVLLLKSPHESLCFFSAFFFIIEIPVMSSHPLRQSNQYHHCFIFSVRISSYLWGISQVSCSVRNQLSRDPVTQSCKYARPKTTSFKQERDLQWIRVSVELCKHYTGLEISSSALFCFLNLHIFLWDETLLTACTCADVPRTLTSV